jgi:Zn/Cd-binding protein ZinT
MKKILSLVLALCLACLCASALADVPASVEDLPETVTDDVFIEDFFGEWQTEYAVYDDEMASLEDAASIFGSLPVIRIDEEKITVVLNGEEQESKYDYDEEYCVILVFEEGKDAPVLDVKMTDTGVIRVRFIDVMLELYMAPVKEAPEA